MKPVAAPIKVERAPNRFGDVKVFNGIVFKCRHCGRPTAVQRDVALKAWGERGVIQTVAAGLRCPYCRRRGMEGFLAPGKVGLGSEPPLTALVRELFALKPRGEVN